MKKLFKECGEEVNKYKLEDGALDFYYISDDINFKEQVTIKDYYRIFLVNNTENLSVEILNKKLEDLKNKNLLDFKYDTYDDAIDILNQNYDLNLELEKSIYYDDLNYFKNGYIVYDKEKNCFDSANNWDEVVTTYIFQEEHGYIATMQVELQDYNIESQYPEVHIDELDEIEETEEIESDESNDEELDNDDEDIINPFNDITVMKKIVIESTSVKKLDGDKYLITISTKAPGHIDIAAIATENELTSYLKNEAVNDINKYIMSITGKM